MFSREKNKFWFDAGFDFFSAEIMQGGFNAARNRFNAAFPITWRPADAEDWNYAKGGMEALFLAIPSK